ncbi:MAG: hypothetical protein RIB58_02815 [Phycisphaerales bacterium]
MSSLTEGLDIDAPSGNKPGGGKHGPKKIIMITVGVVFLAVGALLIARTLMGGIGPSENDRASGMAEEMTEEEIQKIQEEGYVGGTRAVAPG